MYDVEHALTHPPKLTHLPSSPYSYASYQLPSPLLNSPLSPSSYPSLSTQPKLTRHGKQWRKHRCCCGGLVKTPPTFPRGQLSTVPIRYDGTVGVGTAQWRGFRTCITRLGTAGVGGLSYGKGVLVVRIGVVVRRGGGKMRDSKKKEQWCHDTR